jgi:hypothetical protein
MLKIFAISMLFLAFSVSAKIFVEKIDAPKKVVIIKIAERIDFEENIEFELLLEKLKNEKYSIKNNSIQFDTKGGNASAARKIGKIIREHKLNTFLSPKSICGSACIYALIGGVVRNVYGEVTVHRSSYGDGVPLEKIKKFTDWGDAEIYKHIYEMGISSELTAAIFATPHWTRRLITKSELDAWSINGMNRMYEEFSARNLASETKTSVDDVHRYLGSMINNCEGQVHNFSISQWECIRINYYWGIKKLRYDQVPPIPPSYMKYKFDFKNSQDIFNLN